MNDKLSAHPMRHLLMRIVLCEIFISKNIYYFGNILTANLAAVSRHFATSAMFNFRSRKCLRYAHRAKDSAEKTALIHAINA
ncbi:hypothetical protein T03_3732 [Trichinella britovi]|uniref:Uncharacterized protein n=1 Tax=Trichinella britovi TaxID=45882 RepID=A0A0V1CLS6_TRIBR|nr:hypothetical protein T03_3732 [Trichinella britovi]